MSVTACNINLVESLLQGSSMYALAGPLSFSVCLEPTYYLIRQRERERERERWVGGRTYHIIIWELSCDGKEFQVIIRSANALIAFIGNLQ